MTLIDVEVRLRLGSSAMRAVRCHELVGPRGLRVDEVADPSASRGEVVIDVRAAGVNFPDVLVTYGKYQFKSDPPFVPGGEVAGVVSSVGDGVTDLSVGDRVAATMISGAFAEKVAVPATTMHALVDRGKLRSGETLLVLGAAGGVGTAAIEIGKALGARVIAAASSQEKLAHCRAHGADLVIDYKTEDLKERAKVLSGGGVDVIYDPVGGDLTEAALRAMAWGGRHLVIGFASGPIPKVPANLLLLKSCDLVGVFWGAFAQRSPAENRAHVERVLGWLVEGRVKPHVDVVLPFAEARVALERLEQRAVKGKVVLVPGPKS